MKDISEKKTNKQTDEELYYSYCKREKQYLEIIYFQYIRNLKIDNFSRLSLYYYLDISEYLSSKIFNIINKKQTKELCLEEFMNGIILIFSKYFPENGKALTNILFNLISDNSDYFNYEKLSDLFNHLIFEISIKSKFYSYEFLITITKKIREYITKIFGINSANVKTIKFYKKEFYKIIEKNPSFINLTILLLNLITPINEKLISKLSGSSVKVSLNDEFEDEYELDFENEDNKPKINLIPISFIESQNLLKNTSFDKSYNDKSGEKIELNKNRNDKEQISNSFNNLTNSKDGSYNKLNNSPGNNSLNFSKNDLQNANHETKIRNLNININKNVPSKNSQKDDSTDISDVSGNKISSLAKFNENKCLDGKKNIESSNNQIKNNPDNSNTSKGINLSYEQIPKISVNLEEKNISHDNINKDKFHVLFNQNIGDFKPNANNLSDCVINKNNNKNTNNNCNQLKAKPTKIMKEYNLASENNIMIPIKDYKIIKSLEKEENIFSDIMIFYKELKSKYQNNYSENKIDNGNNSNYMILKKNYRILFSKKLIIENSKFISNLEEFSPLIIKIIETDLLLIKQNLNTSKNESIHFINIKNLYLDTKISFDNNEYYFNYCGSNLKYYVLTFHNFKQNYYILFESYNEMDNFLTTINKQIASFMSINLSNYRLIFKTIDLIESNKKPVCLHEINDISANRLIKLQTFKKECFNEDHFIFFKKIIDLCKINKFLKANLFPINNIYENTDFLLVEYVDNEFKINYDKKENNFTISLKKVEISSFIKDEVIKFKKIIKALNNKKFISTVYELIDIQNLVKIKK